MRRAFLHAMRTLIDELKTIRVGEAQRFQSLTLFPLLRTESPAGAPAYLLLEEAIAAGVARVTEMSEGGSVPQLLFVNNSERPILILDGEELVGAKQNRVPNLTILAPPKRSIVIPVSCVEAGRWRHESKEFRVSSEAQYARGRAARTSQVSASLFSRKSRQSDQGAIWDDIQQKAARMCAASPTSAMNAMYEKAAAPLEQYMGAFHWVEGQAGVAFGMGGQMAGLDLFDHPLTMQRLFPKLLRSYALDALDGAPSASELEMNGLLSELALAPSFAEEAVGMGTDLRIQGHGLVGAGLWVESRYVHLAGFRVGGNDGGVTTRLSRPSRRRTGGGDVVY